MTAEKAGRFDGKGLTTNSEPFILHLVKGNGVCLKRPCRDDDSYLLG